MCPPGDTFDKNKSIGERKMRGKNPTRQQKICIKNNRLKPENWLVLKNSPGKLEIQHRETGNIKVLIV